MNQSPSLCPLFPSTIQICRLNDDFPDQGVERYQTGDVRRRFYGNLDMPLNSSQLPLFPDHIVSQMRQHPRPLSEPSFPPPVRPLRRSPRVTPCRHGVTRPPTPPPQSLPMPRRNCSRSSGMSGSMDPLDTRRHGMVLGDFTDSMASDSDPLPSYTPFPSSLFRHVTSDGTYVPEDNASDRRDSQSSQTELRELQRQWHARRRSHPICPTERTVFRSLVSEAFDLPPPYAPGDPYPLFKSPERKPSIWSRAVLYPFVPEGDMLNKAAFATDRLAKNVVVGVKKGVEGVGKKAKAVPKQIESTRAKRKMRWLGDRGFVDSPSPSQRLECGMYRGAYHVVEP